MLGGLKKIGTVLQLAGAIAAIEKFNKEGAPMSKYLPVITTIGSTLAAALAAPDFVSHHLPLFAILNAVAQLLHSVLPSTVKE